MRILGATREMKSAYKGYEDVTKMRLRKLVICLPEIGVWICDVEAPETGQYNNRL